MDYKYLLVGACERNRCQSDFTGISDDFNGASLFATVESRREFGGRTLLRRKENCVNRNVNFSGAQ